MIENPVYLPNGHEESKIPGWYFSDEADTYLGPYRTRELAAQAMVWYVNHYLSNDSKEK